MVSINVLVHLNWKTGCYMLHRTHHTRFAFTLCVLQIDDLECEEIKIVT